MKTSEALSLTLACIWDGKTMDTYNAGHSRYICLASELVEDNTGEAETIVKRLVTERLRPTDKTLHQFTTLSEWLELEHGIIPESNKQMQDYRKAWVKSMIEEFEAKGD